MEWWNAEGLRGIGQRAWRIVLKQKTEDSASELKSSQFDRERNFDLAEFSKKRISNIES